LPPSEARGVIKRKWVNAVEISCLRCGQVPADIEEYVLAAKAEGVTPEVFVIENEGTFNASTGKFWCTECYIALGMPLGAARELNQGETA